MALTKGGMLALGTIGLLVLLSIAISSFGFDISSYVPQVAGVMLSLLLLAEVGFKVQAPFHSLQRAGPLQWATMVVAGLILVNSVLALPFLGIDIMLFAMLMPWALLVGVTMGALEFYTNLNVGR